MYIAWHCPLCVKLDSYTYAISYFSTIHVDYTPDDTLVFTDPETRVSDKRAVSPHPSPVVLSKEVYIHLVFLMIHKVQL